MPIELKNVKIVDLSRVLAGPVCSMILGDLGGDVIKIERPGQGDESRGWGPPFDAEGQSAYFLSCNRNKLSIALDFDVPEDRNVLGRLIEEADVVLENFRAGALAARGIHADEWLKRNPGLIWCTISGFSPGSDRPGYDFVVQAECGWMSITGEPGGDPMKVGVALADILAGKDAAIAILGALLSRDRSRDQLSADTRRLHISLRHSATAALINVAQNALVSGIIWPRRTMYCTRSRALSTANAVRPAAAPMTSLRAPDILLPASRLISWARAASSATVSRTS